MLRSAEARLILVTAEVYAHSLVDDNRALEAKFEGLNRLREMRYSVEWMTRW